MDVLPATMSGTRDSIPVFAMLARRPALRDKFDLRQDFLALTRTQGVAALHKFHLKCQTLVITLNRQSD
jgi:hypothetical protein